MHICVSPLFSCHIGNAIRISFFLPVGADRCIRPHEKVFFIMWLEIVFSPHPCPSPKKGGERLTRVCH